MSTQTFTKDDLQQAAYKAWASNNYIGMVAAATGSGKSRLGVMAALEAYELYGDQADIVIVAPYLKLYQDPNSGWPKEFKLFGAEHLLKYVTFTTYVSFQNLPKHRRSVVILDEAHHLTPRSAGFFIGNTQDRILMLTATPPEEVRTLKDDQGKSNFDTISAIAPIVYSYELDQGVEDGLVADYRIWIVDCVLDRKEVYIDAGSKNAPYKTTEASAYLSINKKFKKAFATKRHGWVKAITNERMHLIYNLRSKIRVAKQILAKFPEHERTIIFCGSIAQANEVCPYRFHSESGDADLKRFIAEEINVIAVVKAVDEGHNLPNVDNEIIVQASSVRRQMVQRIGRAIRWRPGHTARIFVLSVKGTIDEQWVNMGLDPNYFDMSKVHHYPVANLYT